MENTIFAPEQVTALPASAAAALPWRTRGQLQVTVLVKATFAFAPDAEMTLAEPQDILLADIYHRGHEGREVRFTNDRAPYLARADVVFTGHAYAPASGPVTKMPVRIAVYDGDRRLLEKNLLVQDKAPFERMPILYERALAGPDLQENPLGVAPGGPNAPNLVDPADPSRPAGFGPIARAWPARRRLLGNTPREALERPIQEIPDDFHWSYFQSAPPDQQIDYLRGGEWIVLQGLHPWIPELRTRVPDARGVAHVYGLAAFGVPDGQALELSADHLHIDGDEQRCTLTFRGSFPVPSEAALAALRVVAGVELHGARPAWPARAEAHHAAAPHAAAPRAAAPHDATPHAHAHARANTLTLQDDTSSSAPVQAATPFHPGLAPAQIAKSAGTLKPRIDTGTLSMGPDGTTDLPAARPIFPRPLPSQTLPIPLTEDERARSRPALPFEPPPPGAAPSIAVRHAEPPTFNGHINTGTLSLPAEEDDEDGVRVTERRPPTSPPPAPPAAEPPSAEEPAPIATEPPSLATAEPAAIATEPRVIVTAEPVASAAEPAASAEASAEKPPPQAPTYKRPHLPGGGALPPPPPKLKTNLYKRFDRGER